MEYIIIVKDLNFTKQLHIPDDIENIREYIEEWLFAEPENIHQNLELPKFMETK